MQKQTKNLLKNHRGYVSLFLTFVIVIFLVWAGVYMWQKYSAVGGPGETKGNDPVSYLNGIKELVNKNLEKGDIKNERAMELAEETKNISDKNNLVSFDVPQSWIIVLNEAGKNNELSNLVVQSSYFSASETAGKKYYDAGAKFSFSVTAGENKNVLEVSGDHADLIKTGKDKGEGGEYAYYIFKDPDSENGQVIDTHIIHGGNTYLFAMTYNPQTFTDAEYTFKEIMYSVKFLK